MSARDWRIRSASPADLERLQALLRAAELPDAGITGLDTGAFVVACAGEEIIGAAGVEVWGRNGLLRSVVVEPAWRSHSVGQSLTRDRIAWSRAQELDALYLLTTTAAAFFERLGFAHVTRDEVPPEVKRSIEFESLCPQSAACLAMNLQAGRPSAAGRTRDPGNNSTSGRDAS